MAEWEDFELVESAPSQEGVDWSEFELSREQRREALQKEMKDVRLERIGGDIGEKALGIAQQVLEPLSPSGILNQPARIQRAITGETFADPFQPGQAAIAEIPSPKGTSALAGVGKFAANFGNMLQSPESLITLPAATVSAPLRALFAGDIAMHLPGQVKESAEILGNIESTPADKVVAALTPPSSAFMAGLLLKSSTPKPTGIKSTETPPKTPGEILETAAERELAKPLEAAKTESVTVAPEPVAAVRDWDVFYEELVADLDSFAPAREKKGGEIDYDLQDAAKRFVDFAKADTSGRPLVDLVKDFAKIDEASASQIRKLRQSVKSVSDQPPAAPPSPPSAPTPVSAAAPEQSPTSIKNATVDAERAARGLPPAMEPSRRSFGEVWDQAMRKVDEDPTHPDRLISELADKPRSIFDWEDAMLLRRQVELQNEYQKVAEGLTKARDAGDTVAANEQGARLSSISDRLLTLYNVNKAAGTESGRGLNARKMMANEDFTLAKMELDWRVKRGGEKLTPSERAEVLRLNKKIEQTQKAYDEYVARTEKRIADAEALNNPRIKPIVERILNTIDKAAEEARNRLKSQKVTFGSGPLHEIPNIRDYAIIGASKIARGAYEFSKWSAEMVKEFGDKITPHLKVIFDESGKYLDESSGGEAGVQTALKGKRVRTKQTKEAEKLDFEQAKAKQEWAKVLFEQEQANRTKLQKVLGTTGEVINTSRAIITSADLSAVLRQGGFIGVAHPVRAAKSFPAMFKAFRSEAGQHAINQEIANRPNFPLYQQSKLYLSEHGHSLAKMEEAYMSRWADKIPLVAGSQRAYVTFLNKLRADSFDAMVKSLSKDGNVTPAEGAAIANFINVATGRGLASQTGSAMTGLSTVFFAPRYVASRFQLLAGQPFYKGTAATRKMIAGEYARYLIGMGIIYGLAEMAGGEVGTDPTSSDFGKVRFGDTRVDPLSGLSQTAVFTSREAEQFLKTMRGEKRKWGERGGAEIFGRFLRTKLSPMFGTAVNIASGENVVGEEVTPGTVARDLTVPLSMRDIYDTMIEQGIPAGTALALLSMFGMGVQTYEMK